MADGVSNRVETDRSLVSRAEIDALGEIIAATIVMAARTRSAAAAALLERALETLHDRIRATAAQEDDGRRGSFRPS